MKQIVHTTLAPEAIGPYSQANCVGDMVYVSGQLGIDPATGDLREGIESQTRQAMENLKAILTAAGSDMDKIVKCVIYISDMRDFSAVNGVYAAYFADDYPARSCFAVAGLPKGGLVEIEAIAAKK